MKIVKISLLLFIAITTLSLYSCNNQANTSAAAEETTDASQDKAWEAALEKYHDAMSSAFHSAEEDNLEPLKERYKELASISKEWVQLTIPKDLQSEKITNALKDLEKESAAIADVVENGTEEKMKDAIYALHDVFHRVQECMDEH